MENEQSEPNLIDYYVDHAGNVHAADSLDISDSPHKEDATVGGVPVACIGKHDSIASAMATLSTMPQDEREGMADYLRQRQNKPQE